MKNNKIKWIALLALIISLSTFSCTDLSENVYSQLRNDQFFKNEDDIVRAIAPIYAALRPLLDWEQWWDIAETSDEAVTPTRGRGWYDGGIYIRLSRHKWDAYDPHFERIWDLLYSDITNCNRVIYQLDNATFEIQNKESYVAEVRGMRAYLYALLWMLWGNVPVVDKYDVPDDFLPSTNSKKEVFDFIVKELKESIPHLSEDVGDDYYGRFNKWAALTLLDRMYLNAEAWIGTPMWNEVINVSDTIINSNKFILEPNFRTNFALDNNKSRELIFAWPFDETKTPNSNFYICFQKTMHPIELAKTYHGQTWADCGVQAVPTFVNTFDTSDIRYKATFLIGQQYSAEGDSLFCTGFVVAADIGHPLTYTNTLSNIESAHEYEGVRFNKFEVKMGTKRAVDNDWPAMRYAEVLFMKAEAELRLGKPEEAARLVNQVRARAFEPDKPVTSDELAATINVDGVPVKYGRMLEEWGWEFCEERKRRSAQIRFGNYTTGIWKGHEQADDGAFRNLFPIPANRVSGNPNLKQNPGYK